MKNLIHKIFEVYGELKLAISLLLCVLIGIIYAIAPHAYLLWIASPFALYLVGFFLVGFAYAWIINPFLKSKTNDTNNNSV